MRRVEGDGVYRSLNLALLTALARPSEGRNVRTLYTSSAFAGTDGGLLPHSASGNEERPGRRSPRALSRRPTTRRASTGRAGRHLAARRDVPAGTASNGVFHSMDDGAPRQPPADDDGMPPGTTVWGFANFAIPVGCNVDGIYR